MRMFFQAPFLRIFMIPVVLHMIWDLPWSRFERNFWTDPPDWPAYIVYLLLGAIGWFIVMGLVQQGLHQVKAEQIAHTRVELAAAQTGPIIAGPEVVAAPVVS